MEGELEQLGYDAEVWEGLYNDMYAVYQDQ